MSSKIKVGDRQDIMILTMTNDQSWDWIFAYRDLKPCSEDSAKASIQISSQANSLQIWVCANSVNHLKIYLRVYQLMESDSQKRILPTQWFREIFLSLHSGKKTGSLIKIKPSISSFTSDGCGHQITNEPLEGLILLID